MTLLSDIKKDTSMLHLTNPLLGFLQVAFEGLVDVAAAGTEAVQLENRALVHSEKKLLPAQTVCEASVC